MFLAYGRPQGRPDLIWFWPLLLTNVLVSFYSTWAVLETFGVQKVALGIDERRPPAHIPFTPHKGAMGFMAMGGDAFGKVEESCDEVCM